MSTGPAQTSRTAPVPPNKPGGRLGSRFYPISAGYGAGDSTFLAGAGPLLLVTCADS